MSEIIPLAYIVVLNVFFAIFIFFVAKKSSRSPYVYMALCLIGLYIFVVIFLVLFPKRPVDFKHFNVREFCMELSEIRGVDLNLAEVVVGKLGGIEAVKKASKDQLLEVDGVSNEIAERIMRVSRKY